MKKVLFTISLYALPVVVAAQTFGGGQARGYASSIITFVNNVVVPLIIAAAVVVFIFGIFNLFILGAHDEEKRKKGKMFMVYGLVGFVLIFAIQGIISLLVDATGLSQTLQVRPPTIPGLR